MIRTSPWTNHKLAELERFCETNLTMSQIAATLGVSKNQAAGKISRRGGLGRPSPIKKGPAFGLDASAWPVIQQRNCVALLKAAFPEVFAAEVAAAE